MSAILIEGFNIYGSGAASASTMQQGVWADTNNTPIGTPPWGAARTGTYCLQGLTAGDPNRYVFTTGAEDNIYLSCGYACDSLPGVDGSHYIAVFRDILNAVMTRLCLDTTGSISLRNSAGDVLAQTSGPVVVPRNWHLLEMNYNQGTNTFTLRIDDPTGSETPVISATGLSLGNTGVAQMTFVGFPNTNLDQIPHYLADLFIRNDSGSINNGWLGDRRCATLFANADTAVSGWAPSYYKKFGAGILRLSHIIAGNATVQNQTAVVRTVAASALDIGAADFTLETCIRFDALPSGSNYSAVFNRWDSANNRRSYRLILGSQTFNGGCLQFDTSTDGLSGTVTTKILYPWTPETNTWYTLALVRVSGQLLLFVDGEQLGLPITDGDTYYIGGSEVLSIGAEVQGTSTVVSGTYTAGRLDETRFTNGVGRYNATYTPAVAAFPRGLSDPNWASVVLLMGYDSGVVDESSFARTMTAANNAAVQLPSDGPAVGAYSTVNKANPDDNTFIEASLRSSTNILTMTTQPVNGDTITVGTTDGATPAVYTWKNTITTAFDVLIDTTAQNSLMNFLNAVNDGVGAGVKYGTGTTSNFDVTASQLPAGQIQVIANTAGTAGNSISSTETGAAASWTTTTLTGGADIPGPTQFKFQRPPNNTTIISAIQTTIRALKTDAGTSTVQTTFIGPLGGTAAGASHNLSVSARYYSDIIETDPDTSGPLSPTTIINGKFQINRTA